LTPTENVTNPTIHTTNTLKCVEDAYVLTCSRIVFKPTIKKIVLTDKRGTNDIHIEVSGNRDYVVRLIASGIMGLMTDKGYEPKVDVELLKTPPSNPDPPL